MRPRIVHNPQRRSLIRVFWRGRRGVNWEPVMSVSIEWNGGSSMQTMVRPVLLMVLSCCIIVPAGHAQEARVYEARAIAIIRQLYGEVIRDDSRPGRPVIEVNLFETDIDDGQLAILERIAGLRILGLGQTGITDAGLSHLQRLTNLEELDVRACNITAHGLLKLKGSPHLRSLGTLLHRDHGRGPRRPRTTQATREA